MKQVWIVLSLLLVLLLQGSWHSADAMPAQQNADEGVCAALPQPTGRVISVSDVSGLVGAVNSAVDGDTISIADGVYNLSGQYLWIDTPNVTLRSASGNRDAVILDSNYNTGFGETITIEASNVTIADLTIREAYTHPIHVISTTSAPTDNTLIYNVHIIDPGEQAIKINPVAGGHYTDNGMVACSHIELTDSGRTHIRNNCYTGGVDAHQSRDWVIRDNRIEGFWCDAGLSEHAVHFWRASRDTIVERNLLFNNARGVGFGLDTTGNARTYTDDPCPTAVGYVDHYGGIVRNNFILASSGALFASDSGFDCGICLWNACNARAGHNTLYTANPSETFSMIEWRFLNTRATIANNLVTNLPDNHELFARDGAGGTYYGNMTTAQASWFVNASAGDLHLLPAAASAIDLVRAPSFVSDDYDAQPRPEGTLSDVGADEDMDPALVPVTNLRVTQAVQVGDTLTITLTWTPPQDAVSIEIRMAQQLINDGNWGAATVLTDSLPGDSATYTTDVPYTDGTIYFALKTSNAEEEWSLLSNNAFWPSVDVFLPLVLS
ncbi:MAG: hypothetical protein CVU39_14600 [Chloroflexi bacterium HGW-Chloroflexi-10]|nr:MAG: hypothetical protein CVU39_14600 [Chloroflexi bacterium HGW-Chloroflexi-10]